MRLVEKKAKNYLRQIPTCDEDLFCCFYEAATNASRGKRRTVDQAKFMNREKENLKILVDDVIHRRYKPSPSKAFIIFKPVIREIFAATFRDRVIHHFLYGIVAPWWNARFIRDSYSCQEGKGNLDGVMRMQKYMRSAENENYRKTGRKQAILLQFDIKGFFMSLNRKMLYQMAIEGLDKQFPRGGWLYETCKYLWHEIIFDDPAKEARRCGRRADWAKLPKRKSLFCQPEGQGIVIGNLTSQLLSNICLHKLDIYITRELGVKRYGRYVDDFYLILTEEEYVRMMPELRGKIAAKLAELGLELHPDKEYIQPISHGANFLGWRVFPYRRLPSKRLSENFREAARLVVAGQVDEETIISHLGMLQHGDARKMVYEVFQKNGWDYKY
ncbi:RNA-directed DNA polymerase [Candidatus Saccharibacteria bacterium]|nr:RNA-directed DNA polymerase [Candidatus Saccharibacteria bacterium]